MRSIEEIDDAVTRVRQRGVALSTNLFASREELARWITRGGVWFNPNELSLLVLRQDRDFCRVYHVSADPESLAEQLELLNGKGGAFVADLVGRPGDVHAMAGVYAAYGFEEHRSLFRMSCTGSTAFSHHTSDAGVEIATEDDVTEVRAFLEQMLDPYADQIPEEGDLHSAVKRRNVLVTRDTGSLSGVLVFERTGTTALLRYWYVAREARGRGVGARLIRTFFRLGNDAQRFLLWVAEGNEDSVAKYRHFGFRNENLVDRIMLRRAA
jgi:GNAT superfamily N-acetyltransferase